MTPKTARVHPPLTAPRLLDRATPLAQRLTDSGATPSHDRRDGSGGPGRSGSGSLGSSASDIARLLRRKRRWISKSGQPVPFAQLRRQQVDGLTNSKGIMAERGTNGTLARTMLEATDHSIMVTSSPATTSST